VRSDLTISGVLYNPVVVPMFRPDRVLQGAGAILLIGITASLYPAFRARRIDVAEAMKFEA
jgi:ABC-type antimicrobial peptide transport system permease subunit